MFHGINKDYVGISCEKISGEMEWLEFQVIDTSIVFLLNWWKDDIYSLFFFC